MIPFGIEHSARRLTLSHYDDKGYRVLYQKPKRRLPL